MSPPLRILVLTADLPPGAWSGIGAAVALQVRALARRGHRVTVLTRPRPRGDCAQPTLGAATDAQGAVTVRTLGPHRFPVDPRCFDVVHLHSLSLAELAWELHRRFALPVVYTVHALVHRELAHSTASRQTAFWSAVQGRVLAFCHRAVLLSEAELHGLAAHLPEIEGRSRVIPNGLEAPAPGGARLHVEPASGPVVFVGRFATSKGLDLLAHLVPRLLAVPGRRFVFAGGHGDEPGTAVVHRLLERFPEACRSDGWLPARQLEALYAEASLVLVPSRYEPFGMVALEAQRQGAPVLAADAGGLAEVVGEGSGGRLLSSHEVEDWRRASEEILTSPALAGRLRRQGPRWVRERFHIDRVAERLEQEAYVA